MQVDIKATDEILLRHKKAFSFNAMDMTRNVQCSMKIVMPHDYGKYYFLSLQETVMKKMTFEFVIHSQSHSDYAKNPENWRNISMIKVFLEG